MEDFPCLVLPELALETIFMRGLKGGTLTLFIHILHLRTISRRWRHIIDSMISRAKFRSFFDHTKLLCSIFKRTAYLTEQSILWDDSDGIKFLLEKASGIAGVPFNPTIDLTKSVDYFSIHRQSYD